MPIYYVFGHEIRFLPASTGAMQPQGGVRAYPDGWVVITRLLSWNSDLKIFQVTMQSSRKMDTFDKALDALHQSESLYSVGYPAEVDERHLRSACIWTPKSGAPHIEREGSVVGHCALYRATETRRIDGRSMVFPPQILAYLAIQTLDADTGMPRIFHVRLNEPGGSSILTRSEDVCLAAHEWWFQARQTHPIGSPILVLTRNGDYRPANSSRAAAANG